MEEGELGNINKEIKEKQQKELEEKANGQSMASKLRIPEQKDVALKAPSQKDLSSSDI